MLEHLKSRHLDLNLHTVWVDNEERIATFPIWNLSGQLVGYQHYRPEGTKVPNNNPLGGKYFTRVKDKRVGVWGLESWNLSNTLFLTEGIFDACRITKLGYSAIAVFGNDLSNSTRRWLWTVRRSRPVVAVCDNDVPGKKLAKHAHTSHVVKDYKDLGESSEEYVKTLVTTF